MGHAIFIKIKDPVSGLLPIELESELGNKGVLQWIDVNGVSGARLTTEAADVGAYANPLYVRGILNYI